MFPNLLSTLFWYDICTVVDDDDESAINDGFVNTSYSHPVNPLLPRFIGSLSQYQSVPILK